MTRTLGFVAIYLVALPLVAGDKDTSDKGHYGTHTCPEWILYDYGANKLYYCDQYPDDTCTSPQAAYFYGNHSIPCSCPGDCISGLSDKDNDKDKAKYGDGHEEQFLGTPGKIGVNDMFEIAAVSKTYSRVDSCKDPEHIRFEDEGKQPVYARVFKVSFNCHQFPGAFNWPDKWRDVYVAIETDSGTANDTQIDADHLTALYRPSDMGKPCHAYQAKYLAKDGTTLTILTLRARQ